MGPSAWAVVLRETVRRNRVTTGLIYLQVSRGAAPRNFLFPKSGTPLTVVCLARNVDSAAASAAADRGINVVTRPDPRWVRCDIKTVMLLPASLAKEEARAAGAQEVWFVNQDGAVTEGGSSNAWIVTKEGTLVTTPATRAILRGVTRMTAIDALRAEGMAFEERPFTPEEARGAREAFITSATNLVMPVVAIDGQPIGNGHPGSVSRQLRRSFHSAAERAA
ncbi:MAG: aminotransferase class IV [Pseudomonadota bacterium]